MLDLFWNIKIIGISICHLLPVFTNIHWEIYVKINMGEPHMQAYVNDIFNYIDIVQTTNTQTLNAFS